MGDAATKVKRRKREQSSIAFPYVDLSAAAEVARAIYDRYGNDTCDLNDLAADLDDGSGGAFRLKTSAARIFDLIEKRGRSEARITDNGKQVIDEAESVSAKAHAFLKVPLYSAVYDKYKNSRLPHKQALDDELKNMGVPAKQVDKARQVFERSARQAGFFESSDNRLIIPSQNKPQIRNNSSLARSSMMDTEDRFESYIAEAGMQARLRRDDPLIVGLVDRLPSAGSPWNDEARIAWLRLASSIFDVAYTDGSGQIEIKLAIDPANLD